jgi:hypothetical protein
VLRPLALLLTLVSLLALPAAAFAGGRDVIRDCTDDERLSRRYTQAEYRAALTQLAADQDEYSGCREVIRRAQLDALGFPPSGSGGAVPPGGGGTSGGGAGTGGGGAPTGGVGALTDPLATATPAERAAVDAARREGSAPVRLPGGQLVQPAVSGRRPGIEALSELPTPLAVLLGLLAAGTLAMTATRVKGLVAGRRPA